MRRFSSIGAIARSVAILFVVGLTTYGARFALGGEEVRGIEADFIEAGVETRSPEVRINALVDDGAELYMTRCMSCHQMNGRGVAGVFPPLVETEWVTGDKGRLIRVVLNGLTGEIDVEGERYSGAMPPWRSFLDDEQTAQLLSYIRTSWGNEASEVTAAEVTKVRAVTEERRDPWTQDELENEENRGIPGETESTPPGTKDDAAGSDSSGTKN